MNAVCTWSKTNAYSKRKYTTMEIQTRTINDEIQDQIDDTIKNLPTPTTAKITRTYPNNYADIYTDDYGTITYVKVYGECTIDTMGILFFLHNSYNDRAVITGQTIQDYTTLLNIVTDLNERINNLEQQINEE